MVSSYRGLPATHYVDQPGLELNEDLPPSDSQELALL